MESSPVLELINYFPCQGILSKIKIPQQKVAVVPQLPGSIERGGLRPTKNTVIFILTSPLLEAEALGDSLDRALPRNQDV